MSRPESWPHRWRARWIWWEGPDLDAAFERGEDPPRPLDGLGYLRRRFTLEAVPRAARCRLTCDGRYVLFVNGVQVGRGPARAQPWALTYDTYALDGLLRAGENVIAVLARHYGGPTAWWQPAHPVGALGYGSLVLEAEIDDLVVVTDDVWRAREAPYARGRQFEGRPRDEVLDGRLVPHGWTEPGYDDAGWTAARIVDPGGPGLDDPHPPTEPFPELAPRAIPPLAERPVDARADGTLFDLGEIVNGHVIARVSAPEGTVIELTGGEALVDGEPVTDVRGWAMTYIAAGSDGEEVEAFEPAGMRYVRSSHPGVSISVRERLYPREPRASFAASDEVLGEIFATGLRTLDVCSTDAYLDCPGREQRAWLGDAYGHTLVSLVVSTDTRLVRHMLELHARGVRPDGLLPAVAAGDFGLRATTLPDNSLLWILGVARYHEHTGEPVEHLLPVADGILRWFHRHLGRALPGWVFVDWAALGRGPDRGVLDALFVLACDAVVALGGDARWCARADEVRSSFERFWDDARGVYTDTPGGTRVSQHTNALAVLSGCAPRARWSSTLGYVLDEARLVTTPTPADPGDLAQRLASQVPRPGDIDEREQVVRAQPFFSHFVHAAVARSGGDLVPLVRRWSRMLGNGCFGEYWDSPPGRASLCHAWSAVPLHDLATNVLGVSASADGVAFEPHLGDLAWAEGTVATRFGWVRARAERDGPGWVELPVGAGLTRAPAGASLRAFG